jgi:hypothetical protein
MAKLKRLQKMVNEKMLELIQSGILIEEDGINKLHDAICDEFQKYKEFKRPDKRSLGKKIRTLIWEGLKDADRALQEAVKWGHDAEEDFQPLYPFIPLDMIKKRAKYHHGITKRKILNGGQALPGIGRIDLDQDAEFLKKFRLPEYPFDNPLVVEVKDPENCSLLLWNGANIGTRYGADILGNVSRRALSNADEAKDVAVIATNIIDLDLKKTSGPAKIARALVHGDNINPKLIRDPEYRNIAERIIEDQPIDEVVYRPPGELLDDILNGLMKISVKPNHWPEYRGPVYIVLGNNENELIKAAAYWELRWWTIKKQYEIRSKINSTKSARREAENRGDIKAVEDISKRENALLAQLSRTTMSTIATQEMHRFYRQAQATVVRKLEAAIPNAKVIGQDSAILQIGDKKWEIHIPPHFKVTDRNLSNYALQYGPKNLRGKLADIIAICHPFALQYRQTVREADYDGKRGSSKLFVAPIAVDGEYLRRVLRPNSSKDHPLARAVYTEGFQPGILRLRITNGVVDADVLSIPSLEVFKNYSRRRPFWKRGPKYIWFMFCADPHWGGRAKEFVTSKELRRRLGIGDAVFQMMRRDGLCEETNMPVHVWGSPDDQTQGQNFKARTQPHPNQMSYLLAECLANEMQLQVEAAKSVKEAAKNSEELKEHLLYQIEIRGTDFLLDQVMEMMERDIELNTDIYAAILRRFKKSGLIIKGVGDFVNRRYGGFDTRNCGAINFGSGNHFDHTVDGEIVEGLFYAKHLRAILGREPEWRDNEIKKLVAAPLYSAKSIGWSTLQIPGGHEYGFEFRNKPTRMSGWGDTLLGATKNFPMRGNYTKIFNNRLPILSVCGDKHFFGSSITDYAFHHMCASGTHTDRYGEEGFPPNNTGVSFVGLPAEGVESGPVLIRILPFDVIKDFVEDNPRPFDWENFLPNPA